MRVVLEKQHLLPTRTGNNGSSKQPSQAKTTASQPLGLAFVAGRNLSIVSPELRTPQKTG